MRWDWVDSVWSKHADRGVDLRLDLEELSGPFGSDAEFKSKSKHEEKVPIGYYPIRITK